MKTTEILQLYKRRWNEINEVNNHGNIAIARMHTHLLTLTAQTIEQLCERIIALEFEKMNKATEIIPPSQDNHIKLFSNKSKIDEILEKSGVKK